MAPIQWPLRAAPTNRLSGIVSSPCESSFREPRQEYTAICAPNDSASDRHFCHQSGSLLVPVDEPLYKYGFQVHSRRHGDYITAGVSNTVKNDR